MHTGGHSAVVPSAGAGGLHFIWMGSGHGVTFDQGGCRNFRIYLIVRLEFEDCGPYSGFVKITVASTKNLHAEYCIGSFHQIFFTSLSFRFQRTPSIT